MSDEALSKGRPSDQQLWCQAPSSSPATASWLHSMDRGSASGRYLMHGMLELALQHLIQASREYWLPGGCRAELGVASARADSASARGSAGTEGALPLGGAVLMAESSLILLPVRCSLRTCW